MTLRKSGIVFACIALAGAAVLASILQSGLGPSDWLSPTGILAILVAAGTGVSVLAAVLQLVAKAPVDQEMLQRSEGRLNREADRRLEDTQASLSLVSEELVELKAMVAALATARPPASPEPTPRDLAATEKAARELLVEGDDAEKVAARLIANGRVDEGLAQLKADALEAGSRTATQWLRLAALAFSTNGDLAREALDRALAIDPHNIETQARSLRLNLTYGRIEAALSNAEFIVKNAKNPLVVAQTYRDLSEIYLLRHNISKAQKFSELSLDEIHKIKGYEHDPACQHLVAISTSILGDIAKLKGSLDEAKSLQAEARKIFDELSSRFPDNDLVRSDSATCYGRLAQVESSMGHPDHARALLLLGQSENDAVAKRNPNELIFNRNAEIFLIEIGDTFLSQGIIPPAIEKYSQAEKAIRTQIEIHGRAVMLVRDLAIVTRLQGVARERQGEFEKAQELYENSVALFEELTATDSINSSAMSDYASVLTDLGDIHLARDDFSEARACYSRVEEIERNACKTDPQNLSHLRSLSITLTKIGDTHLEERNLQAAKPYFEESLKVREQLAKADPKNAEWQRGLAMGYERIGTFHFAAGRRDLAQSAWDKELSIAYQLKRTTPDDLGVDAFIATVHLLASQLGGSVGNAHAKTAVQIFERLRSLGALDARGMQSLATAKQILDRPT